jgi:phage terminase large subunit-like protein
LTVHRSSISHQATNSKFEPLSADAGSLEGRNPSFSVVDELHIHKTPDVYDVLNIASGARERPLFLSISTSGVDREGICYQVRDYSLKVLQGLVDDDSFFSMVYGIDDGDDWRDPAVWQKANPNYGVSVQPDDLARLAKQAEESPSAETNFKTKRLNVWCSTNSAWLSMGAWEACDKPRPPLESWKGQACYMGLDLASVNDFASVALLFQKDGELYPYVFNYLPMDTIVDKSGAMGAKYREWMEAGYIVATDGSVTDLRYIKEKIIETCEMFHVKQIAFDPYGAHELVSELLDQGLPMVKFPQNIMNMSDPAKEFEKAVLSKRLVHGQDPVVSWMAGNAVIWADVNDNIKVKKDAPANKIDSIIAIIMALGRMKVHAGLAPSPYESRGIRTL